MANLQAPRVVALAAKHHLPAVSLFRILANGGWVVYGPDIPDLLRPAGRYVDKILKGAKPSDLPVQQPTKFELVLNLKTAKALGLTVPSSLVLHADEVDSKSRRDRPQEAVRGTLVRLRVGTQSAVASALENLKQFFRYIFLQRLRFAPASGRRLP